MSVAVNCGHRLVCREQVLYLGAHLGCGARGGDGAVAFRRGLFPADFLARALGVRWDS